MENKKTKERTINAIKTATFLLATGTFIVFAYKSEWVKSILRGHFGELWNQLHL